MRVLLLNFNTAPQTRRCVESLQADPTATVRGVHVLDNSPCPTTLLNEMSRPGLSLGYSLSLHANPDNVGFAAGSNWLIAEALRDPECHAVLLLNNDAVLMPGGLETMAASLLRQPAAGLAGGRMHRMDDPNSVDTLGIALFASLMPADRKDTDTPYIGPTGGCCLLTRDFLEALQAAQDYWFDARFFCYCEDVDLVLRARWLGYQPVYEDQLVALHEGQASSGNRYNDFILYHGLRNSLWVAAKCLPTRILLRYGAAFAWAHLLAIGHYSFRGKWLLLLRVYRDGVRGLPAMLRLRRRVQATKHCDMDDLQALICKRFYRKGYMRQAWRRLLRDIRSMFSRFGGSH